MTIRNTPAARVVCSTALLAAILAFTAEHFDRTELLTISIWAVLWGVAETVWRAGGDKRGRVSLAAAACALALLAFGCLVRPSAPVVRASSYEELVILSEINRW